MRYIVDLDPRVKIDKADEQLDLPVYIVFSGGFNEESAKKFRHELEIAEAHAKRSKQDIVPIVIDSYGGDVYALLSMIDAINHCKLPVATIVEGKAMSCGAILFTCGTEGHRYIGPNATVLIHDVSSFSFGKEAEIRADAEEVTRLNKHVYKLMARNCGYSDENYFYDIITQKRGADWFITPQECKDHNIANHIRIPSMEVDVKLSWKFE